MTQAGFFPFGRPPFELVARHLAKDDDFIADARKILALGKDEFDALAGALQEYSGFLDRESIEAEAQKALGSTDEAGSIARAIGKFAGFLHAERPPSQAMDTFADAIRDRSEAFSKQDRETLIDRIRALAVTPVGLARQEKARELVGATGGRLESCRIYCDIRPIFDRDHESIEGAIPLSILRMEYANPDGEELVFETRVTEKQLEMICEQVEDARKKLRLIKDLLRAREVYVPKTRATADES